MASQFEETIRKAREEVERKMKIIAPRYVIPPGSSYGRPRFSGGGGGSPRGGGGISASQLAEQRRRAEEQKAREAERKAEQQRQEQQRQEQQKARQEQIASGKLTGQISGPQPLTISAYDPESRYDPRYKRSIWKSTKAAFGKLGKDIVGGTLHAPSHYTEEYKLSEPVKKDVVANINPLWGFRITPDTGIDIKSKVKKIEEKMTTPPEILGVPVFLTPKIIPKEEQITYGDIQRGIEEKRDIKLMDIESKANVKADNIYNKYQGQVDKGTITVEEARIKATEEMEKLNKEYQTQQEKIYKKYPDVPGVFERTGSVRRIANIAPDIVAVGTSIGVGAINPIAGASIATGYFMGKGILQATDKPTYKEIAEEGGIFAGMKKDEKGGLTFEETPLEKKYKQMRSEAGINLLFGAAGGIGLAGAYSKSIIAGELEALGKEPVRVTSVSLRSGDKGFDIIEGFQKSGKLIRKFKVGGTIFREGEKTFIMPSGRGIATTTGQFDWQLYKGYGPTYYAGGDIFEVGVKGVSIPVEKGYFSIGKNVIVPKMSFGGVFKDFTSTTGTRLGKTLKVSGTAEGKIYTGVSRKLGATKAGTEYYATTSGEAQFDIFEGIGYKAFKPSGVELDAYGFQKVIRVTPKTDFFSIGGGGTGTVKGFSGVSSIQQPALKDLSATIAKTQAKGVTTGFIPRGGISSLISGGRQRSVTPPTTISITTEKPTIILKTMPPQVAGITTTQKTFLGTSQFARTMTTPKTKQDFITGQVIKTSQLQRQVQEPLIQQPQPIVPSFTAPKFNLGRWGRGFGLPWAFPYLPRLKGGKKKQKRINVLQPTRYQPSFTASVFGIKGKSQLLGNHLQRRYLE